jgi:hypothetical protein
MAQFAGQIYIRPQVVSNVDDSRLVGPNDANAINLAIIGVATGGKPSVPLTFTTARDARSLLRSGELLDAIERAYAPGSNAAGAYQITAVRIGTATQGTLSLKDASAAAVITLTSTDYGSHNNLLAVAIAPGTISGSKITISKVGTGIGDDINFTSDNVGRNAIEIRYGADFTGTAITGAAGTAGTATVAYTTGGSPTATLTTTITGATTDNLNIDLYQYTTLQQVADQINAQGHYTAAVVGPDPNASSRGLDALTTASIFGANLTLTANLQAQLDYFNTLSDLLTATKVAGAAAPAANMPKTYFSGGSDGSAPVNTDWQNAFDVLQSQDVQIIVPISGDATIHAMANTHCQTMSSPQYKRERIAIVGGVAGESVTQVQARAVNLNSDRCQLVYPGLLDMATDNSGTVVTIPPYLVAAQKAGLTSALAIGTSATNKTIGARGLEIILKPSDIDNLVDSGVTVIENRTSPQPGYRIVQDLLSWQTDKRYTRREFSTKMALDEVARELRATLESRIGSTNGPALVAAVRSDLTSTLNRLAQIGILVGGASVPAYDNLTITATGDQLRADVQVSIAVPANFFFITVFPTVFSTPLPASS